MSRASPVPVNIDDQAYLAGIYSEWVERFNTKPQSQLRGGQRDMSQARSEIQVDIQDEPRVDDSNSKGDDPSASETILHGRPQESIALKVESADVKVETSPRYVPLDQHEISRKTYAPPARASPVISVAHRRAPQIQPSSKSADDELKGNPFVPIEHNLMLQAMKEAEVAQKQASAGLQATTIPVRLDSETSPTSKVDITEQQYKGPQGFIDRVLQQKREIERAVREPRADDPIEVASTQQHSVALSPVAEEFKFSVQQEPSQDDLQSNARDFAGSATAEGLKQPQVSLTAPQPAEIDSRPDELEQENATPVEEQVSEEQAVKVFQVDQSKTLVEDKDEEKAEGGLDIAPMLKALSARADTSSPVSSFKAASVDDSVSGPQQGRESPKPDIVQSQHVANEEANLVDEESRNQENSQNKARTVLLSQLPADIDYSEVFGLINGGRIESVNMQRNTMTACVTFVNSEEAWNYARSRTLGIAFKHHGHQYNVSVELLPGTENPDAVLEAYHSCGATRVVEVEDIEHEQNLSMLYKLASGLFGRQIECIVDIFKSSRRTTSFRFASVQDAVEFRGMLSHSKDWKRHIVHFGEDPCDKPC